MRSGAALPIAAQWRSILCPMCRGTQKEQLMERQLALKDVALGQPGDTLDVRWREHLPSDDERLDVRRVPRDSVDDGVAERVALRIRPPAGEMIRRVLYEYTHDVVSGGRHARIDHGRDHDVH